MISLTAAAIIGFILGFLVQRSRFCMTGAIRDYFLFGITRNLKMVCIILGITTFFYTLYLSTTKIPTNLPTPVPAGWFSFVGGIIFGIGMAIAGGCVTSTFNRIGEGSINYLLTAISMFIGIVIGAFTVWKWFTLPFGRLFESFGVPYGLIWIASFPKMKVGTAMLDIPPIIPGTIISALFLAWYYKLEKSEE